SAQFTPAFGINVADFDGDGCEDIFLSQNFFAVQPQTSRNDAGRGLLLKGHGRGAFATKDGAQSGIKIYGEQRGSAAADFDGDGRVDLVVSQNGGATTLLHNIGARPGLRVRLAGPARNPHAIGAVMRLEFEDKWGPSREVNCGSGYWSQNSLVQVLATPAVPTRIQIVWPGGRLTTSPLQESGKEVTVDFRAGSVTTK
ncbi:MAG: ASPIC/UnbV domain protein, partial [Verrucomicrobiales bacterium]|nr:ASPIC/UnbV domain protein [Verrucomicrobiales bacterium]